MTLHNITATSCARWRAALARAAGGGAPARLFAAGDSVTAGYAATGAKATASWAGKALPLLNGSALGAVEDGFEFLTIIDSGYLDARRTYGTGWAVGNDGSGVVGYGVVAATGPSGDFSFGPVVCDSFTITTRTTGSPTWRWAVDSGSYSAAQTGTGTITIPAGTAGSHTLRIIVDSGQLVLRAIEYADSTRRRVEFGLTGRFGAATATWTTTSSLNELYDVIRKPDLVMALLGTNDQGNAVPVATSVANWTTWLDRARAEDTDLLLIIPPPFHASGDAVTQYPTQAYRDAMYQLATDKDAPLLDLYSALLGQVDASHPSDSQHALMAAHARDAVLAVSAVGPTVRVNGVNRTIAGYRLNGVNRTITALRLNGVNRDSLVAATSSSYTSTYGSTY